MLVVAYTASFLRQYKKLPDALREEAREKIAMFRKNQNNASLKAHKLGGPLKGYWSFSVNYKFRIVYEFDAKNTVALLKIGDHRIYE